MKANTLTRKANENMYTTLDDKQSLSVDYIQTLTKVSSSSSYIFDPVIAGN